MPAGVEGYRPAGQHMPSQAIGLLAENGNIHAVANPRRQTMGQLHAAQI